MNLLTTFLASKTNSVSKTEVDPIFTQWLHVHGIRGVMTSQKSSLIINMASIGPMAYLFTAEVDSRMLWAWSILSLLFFSIRFWAYLKFKNLSEGWTNSRLELFYNKYYFTCLASAGIWGSMVGLFFCKSDSNVQAIGWVAIITVGIVATTNYTGHRKTMFSFINVMMSVSLALGLLNYYQNSNPEFDSMFKVLPILVSIWFAMLIQANNTDKSFKERMMLTYKNMMLIDSLQKQTQLATHAVETKNRMLASAAHDIRQPVLALDMYADMLRNNPQMSDQLIPKVTVATRSVIDMFDSLFDHSRTESGAIKINKTNINIDTFMHDLMLQYQPLAQHKGLELRARYLTGQIQSDPVILKRILGNLVANAIKFTEKQGVLFACRKTAHGVRFEVWDTGVGIPAREQQAIFQEFYKVPPQSQTPTIISEGFGLGLSIVARFCDLLKHPFSVDSKPTKGSVFRVEVQA